LTLYGPSNDPRTAKIVIAGAFAGVAVPYAEDWETGVTEKSEAFLALSPTGKFPVLKTANGDVLFESNAIASYVVSLGNRDFQGGDALSAAQVQQWSLFAETELNLPALAVTGTYRGVLAYNAPAHTKAMAVLKSGLAILDAHLSHNTFLVGLGFTLADVVVACNLYYVFTSIFDTQLQAEFPSLARWADLALHAPQFLTHFEWATFPVVAAAPGTVVLPPPQSVVSAAKKEKAPKAKAEEKPKEPKAPKPKKHEEDEDQDPAEAEEAAEKKKPAPQDSLPPSSMDFDEWKRTYSNNETRSVALPWLWGKYDPTGYSFWFAEFVDAPTYLYNQASWKVSNQVGGWFTRLEKMHKYAFGSVCVFGKEEQNTISAVWLYRGTEFPPQLVEVDDTINYQWRRMDHTNPVDKELIEDYFAWDGKFGGRLFCSGKIFK